MDTELVSNFQRFFHRDVRRRQLRWLGVPTFKCAPDLWVYQEILFETQPDLIIETGTASGGSAYFLACLCGLMGRGRVISIDTKRQDNRPQHDRLRYLTDSSISPEIIDAVSLGEHPGERVMVILDSDHSKDHVSEELRLYSPLITKGNYLVVEDTNVNGHPVDADHGAGPWEAVEDFLEKNDTFERDPSREKLLLTFNPGGYLRRKA